jgi:putative transcriptional regulator
LSRQALAVLPPVKLGLIMRFMDKGRPSRESETGSLEPLAGPEGLAAIDPGALKLTALGPTEGYLHGQLLLATPSIGDGRFERTMLMVCEHDETQAMALVVNRPLQGLMAPALLRRLGFASGVPDAPVFYGGPVERERGYVLHSDDYASQSSLEVAPGILLTDTRDVLEALGDPARRPRRFLLALGYAGWGAGQLESEIRQGAWLTCDPDEALLFGRDIDTRWAAAMGKLGVQPERLSAVVGRA